jgi:amino acid transporter
LLEIILFFYGAVLIFSAIGHLWDWIVNDKTLKAMTAFVLLPFTILKYFFKLLKRFDKYFLIDVISFLIVLGITVSIAYYSIKTVNDNKAVYYLLVGIYGVLIIFMIAHKLFNLYKKYDWRKVYKRPEPKSQQTNEQDGIDEEPYDFEIKIDKFQIFVKRNEKTDA